MGRFLQEQYGQEPQVIVTTPLLEGLDGGPKMSKSLGNAIGLNEPADQAYGKLMSISDELMWHYMHILLYKSDAEIAQLKKDIDNQTRHPMDLKKQMAHAIIERFWASLTQIMRRHNLKHYFKNVIIRKRKKLHLA